MDKTQRVRARDMEKTETKSQLYIAFDDLDFSFYPEEVSEARRFWGMGLSVKGIAVRLGREIEETVILLYDQASKGNITNRPNGLFGSADA